jgi:hypothetical protein
LARYGGVAKSFLRGSNLALLASRAQNRFFDMKAFGFS